MRHIFLYLSLLLLTMSCQQAPSTLVQQWTSLDIPLRAADAIEEPYVGVSVWATFRNNDGDSLVRPAFWNGGQDWIVRFAPPDAGSTWRWTTHSNPKLAGLDNQTGSLKSVDYTGDNQLIMHGFPRLSEGRRNIVLADGTPFLVVGDTPWSIPFRATTVQVVQYAADRESKGFNVALLMSVQPDRYAEGPDARNTVEGFDRAFDDLPDGHLNVLNPEYFQYLDSLIVILVDHGIVPVLQPVFHGFGWKGKTVAGTTADPLEYARYCRYLVARYGSMPAFWLVSADGTGRDPGVKPGGQEVEKWDAYNQPTGIHYNPADDYLAGWAQGDSSKCFHYNRTYQDETWLDFQWAQTGHDGSHLPHKVEAMYDNVPVKAVLNGEPTYEGMGGGELGLGWWQGHEAWTQLMHGGTMGVIYGAAALWQWKVTPDEPGWGEWTDQPLSWREAIDLEGSQYVGHVAAAFAGYDFADMERRWDLAGGKPLLTKDGVFYISYLPEGGSIKIEGVPPGLPVRWFDPGTGHSQDAGVSGSAAGFEAPDSKPWVLIVGQRTGNNQDYQ
jgi:hypothetical protein